MTGLQIDSSSDKVIFSIDKGAFSEEVLLDLYKAARLEFLLEKAAFDESVLSLSDDLKQEWWQAHKAAILKRIE